MSEKDCKLDYSKLRVAVLIPCYNEEQTVGKVISDAKHFLPGAAIYVFDNNCTDRTAQIAADSGAVVIREKRQGKGFVVASMFDKVIADYYLMIDGDDQLPVEVAPEMIRMLEDHEADIVVANRLESYGKTIKARPFHHTGNRIVRFLINTSFSSKIKDPMSGMRAFNYEAVTGLPFLSTGFEIETEITLQALFRKMVIKELDITVRERPEGSFSKVRTIRDGISVLLTILLLLKAYRPMTFFGLIGLGLFAGGLVTGLFQFWDYLLTGEIGQPFILIVAGIMILAGFLFGLTGMIIHTVNYRILESSTIALKMFRHLNSRLVGSTKMESHNSKEGER
jgi:glycosyltransferase involved in cell wall biosynthesis